MTSISDSSCEKNNNIASNYTIDDIKTHNNEHNNIEIDNTIKKKKIAYLKKLIMPTLYKLQDKLEAIFYSLDESTQDCEILNDYNNIQFNDLIIELDIILNDIYKLDVGLDTCLIHTAGLLGINYFNKLAEIQSETENINNKSQIKSCISKWMVPLFFYMIMLIDKNSIINSPTFDKDYYKKLELQKLKDTLNSKDIKYNIDNDMIIISNNYNNNIETNIIENNNTTTIEK